MDALPLSALLSQALVAFTIEIDNEAEHQMPHRTTRHGSTGGAHNPWLVSMAMWENCLKFLGDEEIPVRELVRRARAVTNFRGMRRWGYIAIRRDPADLRPKPPGADWLVRATPAGRKAQEVWPSLTGVIERRWQERFGKNEIGNVRRSLCAVERQFGLNLPDCLPILGYGLFSKGRRHQARTPGQASDDLPLPIALSRVLLAFALEFEDESDLSLAISANPLRVLSEKGVRLSSLPLLTGVSKEAINMAIGILRKQGLAVIETDPSGGRFKIVRLTARGHDAKGNYHKLVDRIEKRWQGRFGTDAIHQLRACLEKLVGDATADHSPIFRGLEPYPDNWRAQVPKHRVLPHYPMVLHRGGFPDGS
jgi:DNA-binding MarR family transcriptional regulator